MSTDLSTDDGTPIFNEPTKTHTQYLVIHPDGAELANVHDMLDLYVGDDGTTIAEIYLVTPDGHVTLVDVEDVSDGIQYEITKPAVDGGQAERLEYICYDGENSSGIEEHNVFVNGFANDPSAD